MKRTRLPIHSQVVGLITFQEYVCSVEGWHSTKGVRGLIFLARNFFNRKTDLKASRGDVERRNDARRNHFHFPGDSTNPVGRGAGGAACFLFYARINHAGGQEEFAGLGSPVPFLLLDSPRATAADN